MESYGYIAMFFAMAAENANIPIPSEVILGFAGFLISQGVFEFMPTFIIACLAGIFGSVISYFLGLYGGRPLLLKYGKYIFFNEKKFQLTERLFDSYGGIAVLVCRFFPRRSSALSFLQIHHSDNRRDHSLDLATRLGRIRFRQPLA